MEMTLRLNRQQEQAARHHLGPALVIAGPGSGKTTVIMARLDFLTREKNVPPEWITSLTFSRAAAEEMSVRCARIFGDEVSRRAGFSTIHAFCWNLLKNSGQGVPPVVIEDQTAVLSKLFREKTGRQPGGDELREIGGRIGYLKNSCGTAAAAAGAPKPEKDAIFEAIFEGYEKHKRENGLIDYDDMLLLALERLRSDGGLLRSTQSRIGFLQVDEGQDLSGVQADIVKILAGPEKNIFMVADDDQSIYSFRGAEPDNLAKFSQVYPGAAIYRLEQNFRSTAAIVKVGAGFIEANKTRFGKSYYTYNSPGTAPAVYCVPDTAVQAELAAKIVKAHAVRGGTVGILYRNNISAVPLAWGLENAGIDDFSLRDADMTFFGHWVFRDMKMLFAPDPEGSVGGGDAGTDAAHLGRALIFDESGVSNRGRDPAGALEKARRTAAGRPAAETLKYIMRGTGYFDYCKRQCRKFGYSAAQVTRAFETLEMLAAGCGRGGELIERLAKLRQILYNKIQISEGAAIALSTVHASKGLEYDCVILADVADGEFPGRKSIERKALFDDERPLEEERRLFYVGMTRARQYLYIINPGGRSAFADAVAGDQRTIGSH